MVRLSEQSNAFQSPLTRFFAALTPSTPEMPMAIMTNAVTDLVVFVSDVVSQ